MLNLHGELVTSVKDQTDHCGRIAELRCPQTLASLYDGGAYNKAQAEDEESDDQHRGEVALPNDVVAKLLQPESLYSMSEYSLTRGGLTHQPCGW